MAENKTTENELSVDDYLAAIADDARREDCEVLRQLMAKVTRKPARMWGDSIVGFGSYHYRYDSGREGDMCRTGFSSRKAGISVYLVASGVNQEALLAQLGKHKMSKSCLTIRRLADVDMKVLKQLVVESVAEVKRRYG